MIPISNKKMDRNPLKVFTIMYPYPNPQLNSIPYVVHTFYFPSKILLFRSNQMAQKVAVDAAFHSAFPFLLRKRPFPKPSKSMHDLGTTQSLLNSTPVSVEFFYNLAPESEG